MPSDLAPANLDLDALFDARRREAATREILELISQSRDDETRVFDLVVDKAVTLCEADQGSLVTVNEARTHVRLMVDRGHNRTAWQPGAEFSLDLPLPIMATIREAQVVHIEDFSRSDAYRDRDPIAVRMVETEGHRTRLIVPLLQNGIAIGGISLSRRVVRPFTPEQIALVETFAAQAVVAIDNVRQFRELQTRLAREAATREILEVISHSRDDDRPVFDAILRNANRLCGTSMATLMLGRPQDQRMVLAAYMNPLVPTQDALDEIIAFSNQTGLPMDAAEHSSAKAILTGEVVQIADLTTDPAYLSGEPTVRIIVEEMGVRAILSVPLFDTQGAMGAISLHRQEAKPFHDDEISLIQSFAAQAVIAIENVRQFRELQTRLAREAATREILEVISQSRDDDLPVFRMILRRALHLCEAAVSELFLVTADRSAVDLVEVASLTERPPQVESHRRLFTDTGSGTIKAIVTGTVVHIPDITDTDRYRNGGPTYRRAFVGQRTTLLVPLLSSGVGVGALCLWREEVKPFTPDEIALVETFAAQAVIAIENVRQFRTLEALNAELGDRVQAQVGEIERMGRLKRFLPAAVADAVVSSGSEKMLRSHRALLGVLFCDIRGFTAFCETAEPEETIEVLQTYHDEMGRLIEAHGAGVDHRMGDGIMVLFNDPLPCDDPAGTAVRLGVAMRARMAELCARWKKMGYRLGFGVGISLGYATVGMVGSGGRFDYTASGTAVNLAARLCEDALDGEILLSQRAATAVEDDWAVEPRGERVMKGIREPVSVFSVAAPT